jgi:TrpR family trp operon transcriptional repressor
MMNELADALVSIEDREKMKRILEELLTPAELKNLELRWELMKNLAEGIPQREIARRHGISLCKITRGSKILKDPDSVTAEFIKPDNGKGQR